MQAPSYRGRSPPVPALAKQDPGPPEPGRESVVIPTHRTNQQPGNNTRQSPPVPKLDLSGRVESEVGGDIRASERRPPSILGPQSRGSDVTTRGSDVTKDHVMNQLSALREQLNRLQNVKQNQDHVGKPVQIADSFDTELDRAAKRRNQAHPGS